MDLPELNVAVMPRGEHWEVSAGAGSHNYQSREQALAVAKELCRVSAPAWLSIFDLNGLLISQRHFEPRLSLPWRRGGPTVSGEYLFTGKISRDVFNP